MLNFRHSRQKLLYEEFRMFGFHQYEHESVLRLTHKYPVHIVFGVVTSDGDVMPPFIFGMSSGSTRRFKIKCFEKLVLPWIEIVLAGTPYVLQQHSARWNTRKIQSWLSDNFCNHIIFDIWPLSFQDCNHHDYNVWGAIELETNKTP